MAKWRWLLSIHMRCHNKTGRTRGRGHSHPRRHCCSCNENNNKLSTLWFVHKCQKIRGYCCIVLIFSCFCSFVLFCFLHKKSLITNPCRSLYCICTYVFFFCYFICINILFTMCQSSRNCLFPKEWKSQRQKQIIETTENSLHHTVCFRKSYFSFTVSLHNALIMRLWMLYVMVGNAEFSNNALHELQFIDTYLLPSGWNATLLIGPKWPLTRPISSSNTEWKNLASNFPTRVEVVVTSMASCPPPRTTWDCTKDTAMVSHFMFY